VLLSFKNNCYNSGTLFCFDNHMGTQGKTTAQNTVDGNTATAWFIWTGVLNDDIEGPPRFQEQGREYDELVKRDGRWYTTKRYITAHSGAKMWMEMYNPRTFR
jgi:hypothetical protein